MLDSGWGTDLPRNRETPAAPARQGLGLALLLITTASFACITTFSKFAYAAGSNPETLLAVRFASFAMGVGLLQAVSGRPLRLGAGILRRALAVAFFMLLLSGGYLTAAAFIPVGLAVILLYTAPFFVALLTVLMGRDRLTIVKAATMVLAFAGVAMAVGADFSHLDPRGILAGLAAALGLVLMIAVAGSWMRRYDPLTLNMLACLLLLLPIAAYLAGTGRFALPATESGWIGLAGATLCYLFGNLCWVLAMRLVAPIRMAVIMNLEMPISIAIGALFLGERLSLLQLAGAALVIAAVMGLTVLGRPAGAASNT
jgi:drug/metabolite transporter (DMT)-like permease